MLPFQKHPLFSVLYLQHVFSFQNICVGKNRQRKYNNLDLFMNVVSLLDNTNIQVYCEHNVTSLNWPNSGLNKICLEFFRGYYDLKALII